MQYEVSANDISANTDGELGIDVTSHGENINFNANGSFEANTEGKVDGKEAIYSVQTTIPAKIVATQASGKGKSTTGAKAGVRSE